MNSVLEPQSTQVGSVYRVFLALAQEGFLRRQIVIDVYAVFQRFFVEEAHWLIVLNKLTFLLALPDFHFLGDCALSIADYTRVIVV